MQTATKERAAPSPKSATRATNAGTLRRERRGRQGAARRFGQSVGEAIIIALAFQATRLSAGCHHAIAAS